MGFFQDIGHQFGNRTATLMRRYHSNLEKISSLSNRLTFLERCKHNGIKPDHISHRTIRFYDLFECKDSQTLTEIQRFKHRLEQKVLLLEIKITIKNLKYSNKCQANLESNFKDLIPSEIFIEFKRRSSIKYSYHYNKSKRQQLDKFNRLIQSQCKSIHTEDKWFKNISTTDVPADIANFLALGPKFSIQPENQEISTPHILAEVETIDFKGDLRLKTLISNKITNILTNFQYQQFPNNKHLSILYKKTSCFLKQHPDIIITKADKGNVTVCMNKKDYVELSNSLLSDQKYYAPLRKDPTCSLQQKANKIISKLKKEEKITPEMAKQLTIYNSAPARYYGLPKIHKPQLALRPIISCISSPNSKISQLITDILTRAYDKDNRYYIPDSFHFSNLVNNMVLPPGFVIVSFDVVSLFTNIPVNLFLDIITKKWPSIQEHTSIPLEDFKQLASFVFESTYFTFDNRFYQQIFGTPMGSKVSPIAAQYVMDEVLDTCISVLDFEIPFIKKYVDDIICAIPSDSVQYTLEVLNSYHPNIQFTIEQETNHSVPFLDTLVIRQDQTVKTDWYMKPTASGRYINYHSYHPKKMKFNTIINLKNRIMKVSHPDFINANLEKLYNIAKNNSYPPRLVNKLLYRTPISRQDNHVSQQNEEAVSPKFYKSFPYHHSLAGKLSSILQKIPGLKVAFKNQKKIANIFTKTKDKTSILQRSNVVYLLPCMDCQMIYIGQTSRNLSGRITSHKSDIRLQKNSCQLAIHSNTNDHRVNFADIKVLETERNLKKRSFLEMTHIATEQNTMNSRRDIEGLSEIYMFLLMQYKKIKTGQLEITTLDDTLP